MYSVIYWILLNHTYWLFGRSHLSTHDLSRLSWASRVTGLEDLGAGLVSNRAFKVVFLLYCRLWIFWLLFAIQTIIFRFEASLLTRLLLEELLETCAGMKPVWISILLKLNTLEWRHLHLLLWTVRVSRVPSCHFNLTCLLHEFVEYVIFKDRVIEELKILEVFYRIFLSCRTDSLWKKTRSIPSLLKCIVARAWSFLHSRQSILAGLCSCFANS